MTAHGLRWRSPTSVDEAAAALDSPDAVAVAGGITLFLDRTLVRREDVELVDLRGLTELRGVTTGSDGATTIGALTTHAEAHRSAALRSHVSSLPAVFAGIGNVRIRNQGTVGGNVVVAELGYEVPAALLALDARIEVRTADGPVRVVADDWFKGERPTRCLVTGLRLAARPARAVFGLRKRVVRTRSGPRTVTVALDVRPAAEGYVGRCAIGGPWPGWSTSLHRAAEPAELADRIVSDLPSVGEDGRDSATGAYVRHLATAAVRELVARAAAVEEPS